MIKVTDLGDKVRLQNGGAPTIGVMFDGKFYASQQAAAKAAGVGAAVFSGQIRAGGQVKKKEARYATIEDVKKALPVEKLAVATKLKKGGKVENKKQAAAVKREAKKKTKKKAVVAASQDGVLLTRSGGDLQPLLFGHRRADGGVLLYFPGNFDDVISYASEDDISFIWQGRIDWRD
jgi:hypothetical protein